MKLFFLLSGLLVIFGGVLLIFLPKLLIKIGDKINRMSVMDDVIFLRRYEIVLMLLMVGVYLFYTYSLL